MKSSEILLSFYKAWLKNDDQGIWQPRSQVGLCHNLRQYSFLYSPGDEESLSEEMQQQFRDAGLDKEYPFNVNGTHYFNEKDAYSNEARVQWVKDRIAEAEQDV